MGAEISYGIGAGSPIHKRGALPYTKRSEVNISLFSQSLFGLPLEEAVEATRKVGFAAIELACCKPHFDVEMARRNPESVAERIEQAGLKVSALSGFNSFTDPDTLAEQIEDAEILIRLAPVFNTTTVKLTPGPPGSAQATGSHWRCLKDALSMLVPVAAEVGVRLAFETHMRQLTDTLASSKRLLEMAPSEVVGLTVDFSNMAFAGEYVSQVISELTYRTYNTHLKNGYVDSKGGWHFQALDSGLVDYSLVLGKLQDAGYNGYLTIECLGADAKEKPIETARRDLGILRCYLGEA